MNKHDILAKLPAKSSGQEKRNKKVLDKLKQK